MRKLSNVFALGLVGLLAATVPTLAAVPAPIPEPDTLPLLLVGAGGAWLVRKYLRRK